ncbi:MAG: ATP-binding protein [Clostridia bacterium]|nr:ATP-binding protein [Clostridia bacterium]
MGTYLNPGNALFKRSRNSNIYVDKSGLISYTNEVLGDEEGFICVSRPRRFGKSMAANMLAAYYSRGCESDELFSGLKISQDASYKTNLNKFNVIQVEITKLYDRTKPVSELIRTLEERIINEIEIEYPHISFMYKDLPSVLTEIWNQTGQPFVFIIDEWDCIFRAKASADEQTIYLDYLRDLLKNQPYVALAYMTGILPIKKYGEHSALNMFNEYSMTDAEPIQEYTGFTEDEVRALCERFGKSFETIKLWYDGYTVNNLSIYNPRSVVTAMRKSKPGNFWTATETYEALSIYIEADIDDVGTSIEHMLAGEEVPMDPELFNNDLNDYKTCDDVLNILVHLGYLTYDIDAGCVRIPNYEIRQQFVKTLKKSSKPAYIELIKQSSKLLEATLAGDAETVASVIESVHQHLASIQLYNSEETLANTIAYAYMAAEGTYTFTREMPAGKGFADIAMFPIAKRNLAPIIIELKADRTAETAINQIHNKQYFNCLHGYKGEVILVGIAYDTGTKKHTCEIERITL